MQKEDICEHGPEALSCPVGQGSFKMDCFKVDKVTIILVQTDRENSTHILNAYFKKQTDMQTMLKKNIFTTGLIN